ncbi:MAG: GDP-mannose 4,6-dehydratase [Desulfobacterales bacterium]|nr:GDP-mannose 4,6-dehydratase [Desulfobacterales bacterium]
MLILISGSSSFIGYYLCKNFLEKDMHIIGIDNLNSYYDINLKKARLSALEALPNFENITGDLFDRNIVEDLFDNYPFDTVINLAAQIGLRYSLENPHTYI